MKGRKLAPETTGHTRIISQAADLGACLPPTSQLHQVLKSTKEGQR